MGGLRWAWVTAAAAAMVWSELLMQLNFSSQGCGGDDLYKELWKACAGPLVDVPRVGERVFYFPQGDTEQVKSVEIQIRHPKRHMFDTGWSRFVNLKRLVAGDSVVFLRGANGELRVGVRRAARQQCTMPSSVISIQSMHVGVQGAAYNALANGTLFFVCNKPRYGSVLCTKSYGRPVLVHWWTFQGLGKECSIFPKGIWNKLIGGINKSGTESESSTLQSSLKDPMYVMDIQLRAEQDTDEVYAQITIVPEQDQSEPTSPESYPPEPPTPIVYSFCKVLTASDTSPHSGFSVLKKHANECFPALDMNQQIPMQELIAKDLHGREWPFKHIFRGFQAAASQALAHRTLFVVSNKPRTSQFIVGLNKYLEAVNNRFGVGWRFKMRFEGEDCSLRIFTGTIVGVEDLSAHWENSKWRSLRVQWDEAASIPRPNRVSPWEIESMTLLFGAEDEELAARLLEGMGLYKELWKACAGSLVDVPRVGERVFYFLQGHMEQVESVEIKIIGGINESGTESENSTLQSSLKDPLQSYGRSASGAEQDTDEVYARITLVPEQDQSEPTRPVSYPPEPLMPIVYSFCKVLTASNASPHGGFSVLPRHADECFPALVNHPHVELVLTLFSSFVIAILLIEFTCHPCSGYESANTYAGTDNRGSSCYSDAAVI
ncbi:hypothetical protein C3L33_16223, partial [Rhododendron williamsianum]